MRRATVAPRRNRKKREKERAVERGGKGCRQLEARGATLSSYSNGLCMSKRIHQRTRLGTRAICARGHS